MCGLCQPQLTLDRVYVQVYVLGCVAGCAYWRVYECDCCVCCGAFLVDVCWGVIVMCVWVCVLVYIGVCVNVCWCV